MNSDIKEHDKHATTHGLSSAESEMHERLVMLACPFCGSKPITGNGFMPMESVNYVWCSNEDCELSPVGRDERLFSISWWNTRAT